MRRKEKGEKTGRRMRRGEGRKKEKGKEIERTSRRREEGGREGR